MVFWSCGGDDDPPPPPENQAPSTPTTIYPANNELCIDNEVNFQWNASTDPEGDAITYLVEVSKSNSFSPLEDSKTVSTTSTTITLDKGISFYWRVTAKDSKGLSSDTSSSNGFYTEGEGVSNYAPFSPVLVAPNLNETIQETTANLQWTASDVDEDPLKYDVYFGTQNPPTNTVSSNQDATSYNATLNASTTYYWKIVAKDNNGGQTIGQVWNFNTD